MIESYGDFGGGAAGNSSKTGDASAQLPADAVHPKLSDAAVSKAIAVVGQSAIATGCDSNRSCCQNSPMNENPIDFSISDDSHAEGMLSESFDAFDPDAESFTMYPERGQGAGWRNLLKNRENFTSTLTAKFGEAKVLVDWTVEGVSKFRQFNQDQSPLEHYPHIKRKSIER